MPLTKEKPPARDGGKDTTLPAFALFDPFKRYGPPWLEDGEDDDPDGAWLVREAGLDPDDLVDARRLGGRIRALERALQDIEGHAARLARWRARRERDRETARPGRLTPLRPGYPPGWKRRPKTALEQIVRECNFLALDAWNTRAPPAKLKGGTETS